MLEERNLVEMGVNVIGDRLMILSYLKLLKKKKVSFLLVYCHNSRTRHKT